MVQLQLADDVPERGGGEVLNRGKGPLHAVGVQLRVGDLKIDDRVDLHGHVVFGDDRLRRKIDDLFFERDLS